MKRIRKNFLTLMILIGLAFALNGCIGYVDDGGYYGHDRWYHHDGWYNDGPWLGGPRGYIGIGIHPMRR